MILPIYAYGQPILKKVGEPIKKDYPNLDELIKNMWQTMYNAEGVGLAAPQIGLSMPKKYRKPVSIGITKKAALAFPIFVAM